MTTGERTDQFLAVEEGLSELLDELTKLRTETESYTTARQALETVEKGVRSLASRLAGITEGIEHVVVALKDIGTPALLEGLHTLAQRVEALSAGSGEISGKLDGLAATIVERANMQQSQLDELAATIRQQVNMQQIQTQRTDVLSAEMQEIGGKLDGLVMNINEQVNMQRTQLDELAATILQQADIQRTQGESEFRTITNQMRIGGGILLVAIILATILLIML